ncbi:hypothetical protein C1646_760129 [Rhizophagus diaphanus]|nr:hypothetical protein C1646_760129 [Rhizophagus diaphanus] [Rhizophagus sp. MUCL 43196]
MVVQFKVRAVSSTGKGFSQATYSIVDSIYFEIYLGGLALVAGLVVIPSVSL